MNSYNGTSFLSNEECKVVANAIVCSSTIQEVEIYNFGIKKHVVLG